MTITTQTNRIDYTANGVTTVFPYDFPVPNTDDMKVYFDAVLTTEPYTVNGVGDPSGGNVTFDTAPPNGTRVSLYREVPFTQEADYQPYDPFPAETQEATLDKLTMECQQLYEATQRAISAPPGGDPDVDYTLPVYEAGRGLMWSEADPKVLTTTEDPINGIVGDAEAARDAAQVSAGQAAGSASAAAGSASAAAGSAGTASSAATAAGNAQTAAEAAQAAAEAQVPLCEAQVTLAEAAADQAAENANTEVEAQLSSQASIPWVWDTQQLARITLTQDGELQFPTAITNRKSGVLRVYQDGTGGHTMTFAAGYDWGAEGPPVMPTGAGEEILLGFYIDHLGTSIRSWVAWRSA